MDRTAARRFAQLALVVCLALASLAIAGCGGSKVPDVVGQRQADAVRTLQDAGYKLGDVSAIATTSVEVGLVAAQDPAAGEKLKEGEAVALAINFNNGVDAVVPSVVGLQQSVAVNVANTTGFTPLVVEQYAESVAKGVVAAQVPDAQAKVQSGATLVIVVSTGAAPETAAVPNVVGKTTADAQSAIKSAGFVAQTFQVFDSKVANGAIITQVPAAGTSALKGSTVQIVASLGPGVGAATVPSVVGRSEADAARALDAAGFPAQVLRQYSASVPAGVVGQQFPAGGATAAAGSQVAIMISLGKEPTGAVTVAVPSLSGMSEADAVAAVQAAGLTADVKTITSETVPKGTVGFQYPNAGGSVQPGSSVLVVVSSGPA